MGWKLRTIAQSCTNIGYIQMLAGLSISSISSKGLCKQVCWADGLTHLHVAFPLSIPPTLNLTFPNDYPSARGDPMSSQVKFIHNWAITLMDGALVGDGSPWSLVDCKSIFTPHWQTTPLFWNKIILNDHYPHPQMSYNSL